MIGRKLYLYTFSTNNITVYLLRMWIYAASISCIMESKEKKAKFHKTDPKLQYLEQMSFSNICTFLCLDQNRTLTDRWSNAAVIPKDKKNSFGFSIFGELRVNIRCASLYILNLLPIPDLPHSDI